MYDDRAHTTANEILFLKYLGAHKEGGDVVERFATLDPRIHLRLLRSYRDTMKYRQDWGEIDPEVIAGAVNVMIAELEADLPKAPVPVRS